MWQQMTARGVAAEVLSDHLPDTSSAKARLFLVFKCQLILQTRLLPVAVFWLPLFWPPTFDAFAAAA